MTEAEWLVAPEAAEMLWFLGKKAGVRKRRLFACASVRRIWHLLDDPRSRRAVEVAEAFADGIADKNTAKRVRSEASAAARLTSKGIWSPADAAAICVNQTVEDISTAARAAIAASKVGIPLSSERKAQAALVRDIFGNPFRPPHLDPAWLAWNDSTVVKLAQVVYDDRAFDRLPVLADALEEAGCNDANILDHCRQPGEHVRGCWIVDLLLGKS
jgi:hypothetical protein